MTTIAATIAVSRRGNKGDERGFDNPKKLDAAANAGILVCQGAADGSVKAVDSAANVAAAIGGLLYDPSQPKATSTQTTDYALGELHSVREEGCIWMQSETAQTRGAQPYARYATGAGGTELGVLRNDAVTSETALIPNARVERATTGAGPVLVRLNLPARAAS